MLKQRPFLVEVLTAIGLIAAPFVLPHLGFTPPTINRILVWGVFGIGFDTADVPRDRFLVAGEAWALCRAGKADADAFGILDMRGLWFIAGNLVRDIAALNNREMLPWDVWGAMGRDERALDFAFLDRLARVSRAPDANAAELAALYEDPRVKVPGTVFNAVLDRPQRV